MENHWHIDIYMYKYIDLLPFIVTVYYISLCVCVCVCVYRVHAASGWGGGKETRVCGYSLAKGNVMMPGRQKQIQSLIFSSSSSSACCAVVAAACAFHPPPCASPCFFLFFEYFSILSLWMPLTDKRWWWWWWWSWYARRVLPFDNNNSRFPLPPSYPISIHPPLFFHSRLDGREGGREEWTDRSPCLLFTVVSTV